jgi:hypothetical protein
MWVPGSDLHHDPPDRYGATMHRVQQDEMTASTSMPHAIRASVMCTLGSV